MLLTKESFCSKARNSTTINKSEAIIFEIMKKIYNIPELIVVSLKQQDIITSSPYSLTLNDDDDFALGNGDEF